METSILLIVLWYSVSSVSALLVSMICSLWSSSFWQIGRLACRSWEKFCFGQNPLFFRSHLVGGLGKAVLLQLTLDLRKKTSTKDQGQKCLRFYKFFPVFLKPIFVCA